MNRRAPPHLPFLSLRNKLLSLISVSGSEILSCSQDSVIAIICGLWDTERVITSSNLFKSDHAFSSKTV